MVVVPAETPPAELGPGAVEVTRPAALWAAAGRLCELEQPASPASARRRAEAEAARVSPDMPGSSSASYSRSTMARANSEHLTSVAPSMRRAKS